MSGRDRLKRFLHLCEHGVLGKLRRQFFTPLVRWCNGNTAPFGGVIHGSNPCRTATFAKDFGGVQAICTEFAQRKPRNPDKRVTFPVTVEYYEQHAKIYRPAKGFPFYRVAFKVAGKRKMLTFSSYSEAKAAAEAKVKELQKGQASSALTASQARDALAAYERLEAYFKNKGKRINLNTAIGEYLDAIEQLDVPLSTAVTGFKTTVASVKRLDIKSAVVEFNAEREAKTTSIDGKRPQLSKSYFLNTKLWLGWFEKTFPATAVADLKKDHLDLFMNGRSKLAAKSKNHLRSTIKMFLAWCVRKDYLLATHRLLEASGMVRDGKDETATDFFRPAELKKLLLKADKTMRPIIALQGLAGIRGEEARRLKWEDVFATAGHVTISATKSKTKNRRLVEICPALDAWLKPYRKCKGSVWTQSRDTFHAKFAELRDSLKIQPRDNGLRHGFVTYHFALHQNENATAAQAGHSPSLLHSNYKGLATKTEAEKWFNVMSAKSVHVS